MDKLYQQIIDVYKETGSVKETAERLGTYPIKVRRVLITEGMWESKTSIQIGELLEQNMTVAQIAERLVMSEKNVQSYMPYSRGQYGGENRSSDAVRSEEYRGRQHVAAQNQVTRSEARKRKQEPGVQEELQEQRQLLEELQKEKKRLQDEKREIWDQIEREKKRIPMALQLHLELDMEYVTEGEKEILHRYGRMENSISRDFIVPGTMTLHGLHYAIMKAFGWQNSHLHRYMPNEEEFKQMTGCKVKKWNRLVGMYFRFPSEDYEDIYWDDDYEEGMSVKSWFRSKYYGPYFYGGTGEYYLACQKEVEWFKQNYPDLQNKSTDQREWGVLFEGRCEEMLERSQIWTVLKTPAEPVDWKIWKQELERTLEKPERKLPDALQKSAALEGQMAQAAELCWKYMGKNGKITQKAVPHIQKMEKLDRELGDLYMDVDPEPIPVLSELCYQYDFGDDWNVSITCTNAWYDRSIYARKEDGSLANDKNGFIRDKTAVLDAYGKEISGAFLEKICMIAGKEKPVCIAADGPELVDDIGGIHGFCDFLEIIHGNNPEKKRFYKEWARGMGWTGRFSKPENIL